MKKITTLFTLIIFTLFICLTMIPTALADDPVTIDIGSVSADGTGYTYLDNKVMIHANGTYHITGTTTTNSIKVNSDVTADITFDNVSIDVGATSTSAFYMNGATVNLTLVGNNSLTSGGYRAGLEAPAGSVLTIFGDSTATLTAQGSKRGAGIGGGIGYTGGTITINGGEVTATGGLDAAGIGGGCTADGGTISISGGTVEANAGSGGAGIGGGAGASGGTIDIQGGDITARGGDTGAGIGGGYTGSGGTIIIKGGTVEASAGQGAAGIGGGFNGSGGTFDIQGGDITARGGDYGAGIGGGAIYDGGGAGGTVAISGGTVTAQGGDYGAGIGGGGAVFDGGGAGGMVTISGGTVTAQGGNNGAGIGGGSGDGGGGAGGTVVADGENTTVSATGGGNGYDVGSGSNNSSGGSLTVQNNATVMMNRNGTNANASFIAGIVGGDGAGLLEGTYLNSQKLLSISSFTVYPESGVKAFEDVTLTANVTGLSTTDPQGQIAFYDNGSKIGQASLPRTADGSADATADFIWSSRGGSHTLTAQYVQNETSDSYYMTNDGELADYDVAKIEQASLSISGIPGTVTYGDASFTLSVSGGSGTGAISYDVTGDAVSVADGNVTVDKAGQATITVTNVGDDNYLPVSVDVTITANKAIPPTVVFPSAAELTYGQPLSDSVLTGGSSEGTFAWEEPDTIPTVINSGYNVTFTPNDTDNYDYTGFVLSQNVSIRVNKAIPVVSFPTADEITYEQPLSGSDLTGGCGDGSFAWASPSTIPTVVNSGYSVIFTPDDTDNYLTISQIVAISVQKAEQTSLTVGGVPSTITYGDLPFDLSGTGGSGAGAFSYSVASGDAISVSTSGTVTVQKAGTAQITATKAGDTNYLPASADITITVDKAVPIAVFPTASSLTYGQPLSDSKLTGGSGSGSFAWESADTIPTVINSGYRVVFTPDDTDNYLTIKKPVALIVNKAAQASLTVSGIPDTLTYGDLPFRLTADGGSGTGGFSYAVTSGDAVSVSTSGTVTIQRVGNAQITVTKVGDANYLPVSRTVSLAVNKIEQTSALSFALPETIVYGDAPFQIIGSGGNGSGAFSYQVASGNAVAVSPTGDVTVHRPGEAVITAVKADDSDYLSQEKTIQISVGKGTQSVLAISGIPSRITSGSAPFGLVVNGGSGSGIVSYAVTSGRAVSVDTDGTVTVLRPGTATLTVTKAEDDYYLAATATVEINIEKVQSSENIEETPSASPMPSTTPSAIATPSPTSTATPRPTATDASPSPSRSPVSLKPASIQAGESTNMIIVTINMDDLPAGTATIKLASGKIIQVDLTQSTLELPISQDDLNENGELVIVALDEENTPLGNYQLDLSNDVWQAGSTDNGTGIVSVIAWVAAALVIGAASVAVVRWFIKKR